MTFSLRGLAVAPGIAIGRAVLIASSRVEVAHYFISTDAVEAEIERIRAGRDAVIEELGRLQKSVSQMSRNEAPHELVAMLEVHLMLLQDEMLSDGVRHWICERHYNAEWALTTQLEIISRQFDEMEDPYLRERKADLEQVVERILRHMQGASALMTDLNKTNSNSTPRNPIRNDKQQSPQQNLLSEEKHDVPLVLIAHDLSPADMLQFKQSVFAGFVTDVGGKTSHTAIVARSMNIPAVVGTRAASQLINQDDWVIIDGDAGVVIVDPSPIVLSEYNFKKRQGELERTRLLRLINTTANTLDGQKIELLANIEVPEDAAAALDVGVLGVGLFRSEFLFMGREVKGLSTLPSEEEQFNAYKNVVLGMHGLPVTIRTIDIGADKPLDKKEKAQDAHLNPALGLRAIRWSLSEPDMFITQLRAILRASSFGQINLLIPMLCAVSEIQQTLAAIALAKKQLDDEGIAYGSVPIGAMIEIPAAALMLPTFLKYFDFLSIGTNDLIQYTLAIDRADEAVSYLYDPLHPAVLHLISNTIKQADLHGKPVSVCGEMAGDASMTKLLLGMGLRSFSMHPAQLLKVKQQILRTDTRKLKTWTQQVLNAESPQEFI